MKQTALITALLFPGQGSQEAGMGRESADANKDCMQLWKKAEQISGLPLRNIYWDGDAAAMADTRALQPALTVTNLALWLELAPRLSPACAAGHSLGEYSALAAAQALSIDAVLEVTSLRGRLMAEADPSGSGAMAAILKLGLEDVQRIVAEVLAESSALLCIANYNTPGQFVISGSKEAIELAGHKVKESKGRAVTLAVSGAFHSPLMAEAAQELTAVLQKLQWNSPRFPVWCNSKAAPLTSADSLKAAVCEQMTSSVLWIDTIVGQWQAGVTRFVEVGPKGVLTRMLKPILSSLAVPDEQYTCFSVDSPEQALSLD